MIFIGFSLFALTLGLMIGASNSPVVAPFVAIVVGLLGSIFGVLKFEKELEGKNRLNIAGSILSVFSVFLLIGLFFGESYRSSENLTTNKSLPWSEKQKPESLYEAIDWIVLSEKLISMGYKKQDIVTLYSIRLSELIVLKAQVEIEQADDTYDGYGTTVYDISKPYHEVIPSNFENARTSSRGLASVE